MTIFKASVHKRFVAATPGDTDWRNVYTLDVVGPEAAITAAELLMAAEQICHSHYVAVFALTLTCPSGLFNGRRETVSEVGSRSAGTNRLPGFNVCVVTFTDLDFSRPEVKYIRAPIYEEDHAGGVLDGGILSDLSDYGDAVLAISGICGAHGETLTGHAEDANIRMRQENWHRRSRPGFHRGYVANS